MRIMYMLAIFVLAAFDARADILMATGKLSAATVYPNRASVTETARVAVPAGAHKVVFADVGADILPDSLRVEGVGTAPVKLGAITHAFVSSADLAAPREKELNDALVTLQDQRRVLDGEKTALTAKQTFLNTLAAQGAARTQEQVAEVNLKPEQWSGAAAAIFTGLSDTFKAQVAVDAKIRDLDAQIAKVQADLNQVQTGARNTYRVEIPVEASAATDLTLNLTYQTPNAGWRPLYDARLNTQTAKLDLVQYGAVRQQTGRDWRDVKLTLSTAQPARGADLPELSPLWVNILRVMPMAAPMAMATMEMESMAYNGIDGAEDKMMRKAVEAPPAPVRAEMASATIETGGYVGEYKIAGPASVLADGSESKLLIGTFPTESKLQISVKPQMSTDAYLIARATLKGEAPILPGDVSLFRDGAFVGQVGLPLLRPGQERDLGFGIDDQVAVTRKVVKDVRSESGVLSKETMLERQYVTQVQNLHAFPVEVKVAEATPVAQDTQIRVEILGNTTAGYTKDVDQVTGVLGWTLPLAAREKKDVTLGLKLAWPKGQDITGF